MTPKERILAALNGQQTDTLPFIPRLDIWYNANAGNGTSCALSACNPEGDGG